MVGQIGAKPGILVKELEKVMGLMQEEKKYRVYGRRTCRRYENGKCFFVDGSY